MEAYAVLETGGKQLLVKVGQKVEIEKIATEAGQDAELNTVLAVSDAEGNVRGYVHNPQISLLEKYRGKLDVGAAVGTDGMLAVIRDLQMKEPYVGSIELITGEIGDDVTAYFVQSEQIPTACALGVLVDRDQSVKVAGGYLIQLLPGAPDDIIDKLEEGIRRAGAITPMLEAGSTTVWETELGEQDFSGAGSLCHGWSAMPIYYYHTLKV